ncbi:related to putative tartrate transporter [Rhynchosporium graminicola]|uniref:Related to putative tartrate transporter n=1 Tax=Rhynchosporium graminicola TaxID=2792576 RepID=A0A1E1L112_9HELO|nr:related to putative tartrate transporter [Rhynchosporium commune]
MRSSDFSEKNGPTTGADIQVSSSKITSIEGSNPKRLHLVQRGDVILESEVSDETITGYDADLMRARASLTADEEKKLMRRVDWRIIPLCAVMYAVKNIDSSNVSNARIMDKGTPYNIMTELKMTENQYNLVTTMYFIPYILAEVPSNLLLKKVRPSVWQARIMISWSVVLLCHAAVANRQGLYTVRFFLGLFEAGLWPGIVLHLCYWYRPDEIAPRVVWVTLLGNFSPIVSGVLAFAFNGVNKGLSSWKWLIFTEGLFTVLLGLVVFFHLPDFPATAKWLTDREKAFLQARLPRNSPRAAESSFSLKEFWVSLKDIKIWLFLLCWAFYTVGTSGLMFYQPTVIDNLGFTGIAKAQLLNIPPAIFSCLLTIAFGIWTDTGRIPLPLIPLGFMIVLLACYAVLFTFPNTGSVYAATVIAGGFSIAWYTVMWPWRVQTTSGATGSAFAIGFTNSYGNVGGAVGALAFDSKYAPRYATSFGIAMGFIGAAIIMNIITWGFTWRVDVETRRLKRERIKAARSNAAVLDDVDILKLSMGEKKRGEA